MSNRILGVLTLAIRNNDRRYFSELIEETVESEESISEDDGFNIFHCLSVSQLSENLLLDYARAVHSHLAQRISSEVLISLINSRAYRESKQTPLQISIARGKSKLALFYLNAGADPLVTDDSGKNSAHFAAKSGALSLYCHLIETKLISTSTQDMLNNTPLHLAILERREAMSLLIIALSSDLNSQNSTGDTALHLSVLTGNYRITRHLILRGCRKDLRNNSGALAEEVCSIPEIRKLFATSLQKRSMRYYWLVVAWLALQAILMCLIEKADKRLLSYDYPLVSAAVFLFNVIMFSVMAIKSPGYEPDSESRLQDLYEKYNSDFVCAYCVIKKHKATRHCMVCQRCIRRYDHHCKWINNCVGQANFVYFVSMIGILLIECLLFQAYIIWILASKDFNDLEVKGIASFVNIVVVIVQGPACLNIIKGWLHKKKVFDKEFLAVKPKAINNEVSSDTESMLVYERSDCSNSLTQSRKSSLANVLF